MSIRNSKLKELRDLLSLVEAGAGIAIFRRNMGGSGYNRYALETPDGKIMPVGNESTAQGICKVYGWKLVNRDFSRVSEFFDDSDPKYPDEVNMDPKDGGTITFDGGDDKDDEESDESDDQAKEFLLGHFKELGADEVTVQEEDGQVYYDIKFNDDTSASLTILPPKDEDDQHIPALVVLLGPDGTLEDWPIPEEAIGDDDTISVSGLNIVEIRRVLEEMIKNSDDGEEEDDDDYSDNSDASGDTNTPRALRNHMADQVESYLGPKMEVYRFVVRGGKRVRKSVVRRKRKRLSTKQKNALRKARKASHRGAANRKRKRSQGVRKRLHLKSGGLGRGYKLR